MALQEADSRIGHSFGLEFDGITIKAITEVTGLKMQQDVVEYRQNGFDGEYQIRRLPGRHKTPDITLTRRLTADQNFDHWVENCRDGQRADVRKGGAIIVFDDHGNPIKRYKLINTRPKSLEISSLKAGDTLYLSEKLILSCESIEVE
jgi:phage tail-like protein